MSMSGLKELAGENFWQCLPLYLGAQHPLSSVSRLWATGTMSIGWKLKGSSTWTGLQFFWVVFFHPDLYFQWWVIFVFYFSPQRAADCKSFAPAGLSHPHCLLPHGKMAASCTTIAPHRQIPPRPPASHFTYRVRGCCRKLKGIKKSQMQIEILVAWLHASTRCAQFSVMGLWHIYSYHKNSSQVAGWSHWCISPSVKLPTKSK